MRLVVADTTPLNYLVLIEQVDLLACLFERIYVPQAVKDELVHSDAPSAVRTWAERLPSWVDVVADIPLRRDPVLDRLDEGERAAIEVAVELKADLVLMDDRDGVKMARARGLAVTGTLGVLDLGARRGLLQIDQAFDRLRMTNFRCHPDVMDALLARHRRVSEPKSRYV